MATDSVASERLAYLLGRVALGDRAAFKDVYALTSRFLLSVAFRRLNNRERAEEVLQEAFLEVWRKIESYSASKSRPMTWLMTIVDARAIDLHRRLVTEGKVLTAEELEEDRLESAEVGLNPSAESFRDNFGMDVGGRLADCFQQLSKDQRLAILNVRIRGMTIDEAAELFRVPRQTAAAWVRRGIQRLSECMGHESARSAGY